MFLCEARAAVPRMASEARVEKRQGFSVPATTKENGSFPHHIMRILESRFTRRWVANVDDVITVSKS